MDPKVKVQRQCPVCGIIYEADPNRLKHGRQVFCSRKCSYQGRYDGRRNRVSLICSACGKEFSRSPSGIKSKHEGIYCSRECHYVGRGIGLTKRVVTSPYRLPPVTPEIIAKRRESSKKAHATSVKNGTNRRSDETRAKISLATARAIADGKIKPVSKIEGKVSEALAAIGVVAIPQYLFRGTGGRFAACVDFYIPTCRTAIEVNGTFWHADPRVYDGSNLKPAQVRTVERYARKKEFLKEIGVELLEVWELDIDQKLTELLQPLTGIT